jgi:RNA ligase (TIGR02306 family)
MGDQEGFRLKTIKLRGQVSQGLILPISVVPIVQFATGHNLPEGLDVTEMLGIVKYEPPIPAELSGKVKGGFPSFLRKTDEERIQNLVKEYEEYKLTSQHQFYMTEKLDGSSATFYMNDGVFGVCSRNLELLETEGNTFWKVARELDLENKFKNKGNICLQGELIGEGIQGNPYKIKGQTVHFFNGFDIDTQTRMNINDFLILLDELELLSVPILDVVFLLPDTVEGMLKLAEDKSRLNKLTEREGVVVRSLDNTISFKAISNKFLLSEK